MSKLQLLQVWFLGVSALVASGEGKVDWGKRSKMTKQDSIMRANKADGEYKGEDRFESGNYLKI